MTDIHDAHTALGDVAAELHRTLADGKSAVMDIDAAVEALVDSLAGRNADGAASS